MNLLNIIKKNSKLYVMLLVVIIFGTIGISFALITSGAINIGVNTSAMSINANITYNDGDNGAEIVNSGNMIPISDTLVTGPDVTDSRVLKAKFNVSGVSSNPSNTIYDISLRDIDIDCELRSEEIKWRLYKGTSLISEGNLSPAFDTMNNNRMVLTEIQEDLTTSVDSYTFLLWISESCTGDVTQCDSSMDQSIYLNRSLKASIKVELATGSKKELVRTTGSEESCSYTEVEIPVCNTLTYNGTSQTLINSGSNYTLENTTGLEATKYAVTARLNDGYKWSTGETDDRVISCSIDRKKATITTLDQNITYGQSISSTINDVSVSGLVSGDRLESVSLTSNVALGGEGLISINNVKIVNSNDEDVTNNYNILKNNTGKLVSSYVSYVVTLDNKGASSAGTTTLYGRYNNGIYLDSNYSNRMSSNENNITIPSMMGYTFNGYYTGTNGSGTKLIDSSGYKLSNFNTTLYNSNVTLYADWDINTYNVCFNANGGTGAPECVVKTYGQTLILPSTMPTLGEEYNFVGWSTDKNATSATYAEGSEYNVNASATLYAVYEKITPLSDFTYYLGSEYPVVESVSIENVVYGNVNYRVSPITLQENDVLIVDYIGDSKDVLVPNTYILDNNRYNTILLSSYWDSAYYGDQLYSSVFMYSADIVSVELDEYVKFIHSNYSDEIIVDGEVYSNLFHNIETNVMYYTFSNCTNLVFAPVISNLVTKMHSTFYGCTSLVTAPAIPNSVIDMTATFGGCTNLVNAPVIPDSVTSMNSTFSDCTNLVNAPVIPDSVTSMISTFSNCTNLVNAPVIPDSVTSMNYIFYYCANLTGNVRINSSDIDDASGTFSATSKDITVEVPAGSTTYSTFSNASLPSNVTVTTY